MMKPTTSLLLAGFLFHHGQAYGHALPVRQRAACGVRPRVSSLALPASVVSDDGASRSAIDTKRTLERQIPTQNRRVISPLSTLSAVSLDANASSKTETEEEAIYKKGLAIIALITFLFASNSPALHAAYSEVTMQPPVLLLNAACSSVAMVGMLAVSVSKQVGGMSLPELSLDRPSLLRSKSDDSDDAVPKAKIIGSSNPLALIVGENNLTLQAGMELGLWKFLGTLANMYGLSQTSADHGAFLIQLTTLFVPLAQGVMGVPIPLRIWTAIALALAGVAMFTQDGGGATSLQGDVACVAAAVMYATYDLRLFHWGKLVEPLKMITAKIATQTTLSMVVLAAFAAGPSMDFLQTASPHDLQLVGFVALWSGLAVNALAPYLQVFGQQAVGPARAQILYASQPLWASVMSFFLLGETVGSIGLLGGAAFLGATMVAATAELPDPNCDTKICET